jgi:peroxiredoxin
MKMTYKTWFAVVMILGMVACGRNRIVISGNISHADTLLLYLEDVDVHDITKIDSASLNANGNFRFAFRTDGPGFYQIRLSDNQSMVLFPEPGQQLNIETDARRFMSSMTIDGSTETEQVFKVVKGLSVTKSRLDSINRLFSAAEEDSIKDRLMKDYDDVIETQRQLSIAFILTHYNSLASLYVLYQQYQPGSYLFYKNTDLQLFRIVSDSLKKYYPSDRHVIALEAFTENLIADYRTSMIMQLAENAEATLPKVELPDIADDTISLASVNARYVLLNFWATWSQESIEQNRQLLRVYNDFRGRGFEVMAVSLDNSIDDWSRAIKFDELYWINVIDKNFPNSRVAASYNVTALPSTYLIDMENVTILAKNLSPSQLQERLSGLLR